MTERYTGRPENQRFARGGASGNERAWQKTRESANPFANQTEQTASARENIRNLNNDRQQWFRSSRKGTLTEIRDILRRQEISREFEDMVAFRQRLNEKLDRKRDEALAGTPEGEEKLTIGKLVLLIIAGLLSAPADIAEQTAKDAQEQAKAA
jgi:hypothetical protein